MTGGPLRRAAAGLVIDVRVTPKAQREEIAGLRAGADGTLELIVKVNAAPERGRANRSVLALLAKALGLPRTRLSVLSGETGRHKAILIAGNPETLEAEIAARLKAYDRDDGDGEDH